MPTHKAGEAVALGIQRINNPVPALDTFTNNK